MAYSNWGAFVYKNGERRKDKEDVGVFDTDEANVPSGARIFSNILKNKEKHGEGQETPWYEHSHHAVLGDGVLRLVGYKHIPELYVMQPDGSIEDLKLIGINSGNGSIQNGEYYYFVDEKKYPDVTDEVKKVEGVYTFSVRCYDGNMLDIELREPDGTVWKSTCGYLYGAGHMED